MLWHCLNQQRCHDSNPPGLSLRKNLRMESEMSIITFWSIKVFRNKYLLSLLRNYCSVSRTSRINIIWRRLKFIVIILFPNTGFWNDVFIEFAILPQNEPLEPLTVRHLIRSSKGLGQMVSHQPPESIMYTCSTKPHWIVFSEYLTPSLSVPSGSVRWRRAGGVKSSRSSSLSSLVFDPPLTSQLASNSSPNFTIFSHITICKEEILQNETMCCKMKLDSDDHESSILSFHDFVKFCSAIQHSSSIDPQPSKLIPHNISQAFQYRKPFALNRTTRVKRARSGCRNHSICTYHDVRVLLGRSHKGDLQPVSGRLQWTLWSVSLKLLYSLVSLIGEW